MKGVARGDRGVRVEFRKFANRLPPAGRKAISRRRRRRRNKRVEEELRYRSIPRNAISCAVISYVAPIFNFTPDSADLGVRFRKSNLAAFSRGVLGD